MQVAFSPQADFSELFNDHLPLTISEGKEIKMKEPVLFIMGAALLFFSCEKLDVPKGTPKCIVKKINKIAKNEVWNPPAKIYSYSYKGETVFYFPPRCCDIPSEVYDEDCNSICSPDGGFSGSGDGNCDDFFDLRADEKLVWEDDRSR